MTYWLAWAVFTIINLAILAATSHNLRETVRLLQELRDQREPT